MFCDYTVEEINLREEKEKNVSCLFYLPLLDFYYKLSRQIPPIRGSVGNRAFEDTLLSYTGSGVDIVYIVSNHTGTIDGAFTSSDSLKRPSPHLIYTGTQEEFNEKYKNNTGKSIRQYQCIGDNVKWDLEDGVLTISGSGPTIDLVNINEQPWLNIPEIGRAHV